MRSLISFCMICKNEETFIERCLQSVKNIADEMIVVDTGSTDRTIEIAKKNGATILQHEWKNDFSLARNVGLNQAKGEWILFLDADEELHPEDGMKVRDLAKAENEVAYYFKILNFVGDSKANSKVETVPVLRFFRNNNNVRFEGRVHEQIGGSIREQFANHSINYTSIRILHYGYLDAVVHERNKIDRNFTLINQQVKEEPENPFHRYNLAGEYIRLNDFENALIQVRAAKSLCQIEQMGFGHLIVKKEITSLLYLGRNEEAFETCCKEIHRFNDYPDLYFLLGRCAMVIGKNSEAKNAFKKAMSIVSPPPYYSIDTGIKAIKAPMNLGQIYEDEGNDKQALFYYGLVIKNNPNYLPAYHRIIHMTVQKGMENLLIERLKGIDTNEVVLKNFVHRLYESECYHTAKLIIRKWKKECKDLITLEEKLDYLIKKNPFKQKNSIYSSIQAWVLDHKELERIKKNNNDKILLNFLLTGDWPDQISPSETEWDLLDFAFRLCQVYKKTEKSKQLLQLWRFFAQFDSNPEQKWSLGLKLCTKARTVLKSGNESEVNHIWKEASKMIPFSLLEREKTL